MTIKRASNGKLSLAFRNSNAAMRFDRVFRLLRLQYVSAGKGGYYNAVCW